MKRNMSNTDRTIRIGIAAIIAGLYFSHVITGTLATVLLIVGGIFVLTSLVSFCPLYSIFKMSTCKAKANS